MSDIRTKLVEGYKAFKSGDYPAQKALYETLGGGQSPKVMLIGCADSRVDPSDIFGASPGELFVARNVANFVPPHNHGDKFCATSAALEYAVTVLKVEMVVVLGHASCGGIAGCLAGMGDDPENYVGSWVALINEARDRVLKGDIPKDNQQLALEYEGIRQSLLNLMTFPFVRQAVESGDLQLQGAYFSIGSAELRLADDTGEFSAV